MGVSAMLQLLLIPSRRGSETALSLAIEFAIVLVFNVATAAFARYYFRRPPEWRCYDVSKTVFLVLMAISYVGGFVTAFFCAV